MFFNRKCFNPMSMFVDEIVDEASRLAERLLSEVSRRCIEVSWRCSSLRLWRGHEARPCVVQTRERHRPPEASALSCQRIGFAMVYRP
jgi:hypothetical protein